MKTTQELKDHSSHKLTTILIKLLPSFTYTRSSDITIVGFLKTLITTWS